MSADERRDSADIWRRYEMEKAKARSECQTPETYEERIKDVVRRLGI